MWFEAGRPKKAEYRRFRIRGILDPDGLARAFGRELTIALANGVALGTLIGTGVALIFNNPLLGGVIGAAMVITNLAAGLGGIFVPVTLDRARIDPAVSSAVFVTTITDVTGFFSFLGLAAAVGLGR